MIKYRNTELLYDEWSIDMDYRPDMDAHLAAKKRQYAKRKKRGKIILIVLLCITIAAVWALIGVIAVRLAGSVDRPVQTTVSAPTLTAEPAITGETTTAPIIETKAPDMQTVLIEKEQVAKGSLILVSSLLGRAYDFEQESNFVTLYGNKSGSYRISSTALKLDAEALDALNTMFDAYYAETGNRDYQVTQASRTFEEQKSIYDSYLKTYGAEQGALLAAQPGYSEHHSGYAIDMNVYTSAGISHSLATAGEVDPIYSWIYENAAKYGFVERYPEGKTTVTGITYEPWHFRYVGRGHAAYMVENDLVLEEYIALLYKYPYDGEHLTFSYDGVSYEVFFVPFGAETEAAEITLRADATYTISGNNWDGVIVTVSK